MASAKFILPDNGPDNGPGDTRDSRASRAQTAAIAAAAVPPKGSPPSAAAGNTVERYGQRMDASQPKRKKGQRASAAEVVLS